MPPSCDLWELALASLCYESANNGLLGSFQTTPQVFSQDSSAWDPVLSHCLYLYPYSICILHWEVQVGGSCQPQPPSALIISKSPCAHYLWVETRLLQPLYLTQQIPMMRICPYGLFLLHRFLPGVLVPSWFFFFFSPFLPGYWLRGDISCSFVYIGDHLQDLWQLLLFLCVCVCENCWLIFCENCSTCKCTSDVCSWRVNGLHILQLYILILLAICFLYLWIMWTF